MDPGALTAVLVTHEHTDHMAGLATLIRQLPVPVYTAYGTARQLCFRIPRLEDRLHPFSAGDGFSLGPLWCQSFPTSHDAAESVGYTLSLDSQKLAVATDLGHITEDVHRAVLGAQWVVVEANHDEDWVRSGPYPYYLRQRILGDRGHLCNEAGAELAARAVEAGAHTVVLAHLSAENNTPERARSVAARRLELAGVDPERDIRLTVAPRAEAGPVFTLNREGAVC